MHEKGPFFPTEARCEHRAPSDLRWHTSNLPMFAVMKPRGRCVRLDRSENKIALWRSLVFQRNFLSAASGEHKTSRRLRVY